MRKRGDLPGLRHECGWQSSQETGARCCAPCLVARWPEDRVPLGRATGAGWLAEAVRHLRHERRRERKAEPDANPPSGKPACVVARAEVVDISRREFSR